MRHNLVSKDSCELLSITTEAWKGGAGLIPKYQRYYRPIVHFQGFCFDELVSAESNRNCHNHASGAAAPGGDMSKYNLSFDLGEPERYRIGAPKTEVHILDAGHFALDGGRSDRRVGAGIRRFQASRSRRGRRNEAALRGPVIQLCIGFEPLKRKVIYVWHENSNHNWRIRGYWRGFSRRVSKRRL
jgi:hypothetical protein